MTANNPYPFWKLAAAKRKRESAVRKREEADRLEADAKELEYQYHYPDRGKAS